MFERHQGLRGNPRVSPVSGLKAGFARRPLTLSILSVLAFNKTLLKTWEVTEVNRDRPKLLSVLLGGLVFRALWGCGTEATQLEILQA
jgi:hypothetical protein